MSTTPLGPPPLLVLTPGTLQRGPAGSSDRALGQLQRAAAAAVAGGVRAVLVREPHLEDGAVLELARRLRALLDAGASAGTDGVWLGIHDRLHLAVAAGADGVHVGGRSLPSTLARGVVGPSMSLGVSTHAADGPDVWEDADYVLHGPVFAPNSKVGSGEPIGPVGLREFVRRCGLPVFAVGGMDGARAQELHAASVGHRGVAAIGAVWGTDSTPVDGRPSPLTDLAAIETRARALVDATTDSTPTSSGGERG